MIVCSPVPRRNCGPLHRRPDGRTSGLVDAAGEPTGEFFHPRPALVLRLSNPGAGWNSIGSIIASRSIFSSDRGAWAAVTASLRTAIFTRRLSATMRTAVFGTWRPAMKTIASRTSIGRSPPTACSATGPGQGLFPEHSTVSRTSLLSGESPASAAMAIRPLISLIRKAETSSILKNFPLPNGIPSASSATCPAKRVFRNPAAGSRTSAPVSGFRPIWRSSSPEPTDRNSRHQPRGSTFAEPLPAGVRTAALVRHLPRSARPAVDYRARCLGCHAPAVCPTVRNQSTSVTARRTASAVTCPRLVLTMEATPSLPIIRSRAVPNSIPRQGRRRNRCRLIIRRTRHTHGGTRLGHCLGAGRRRLCFSRSTGESVAVAACRSRLASA